MGDRVIVNGTTGSDTITFTPTADDAATMTGVQGVATVSLATVESLAINGLGGNDTLVMATGAGHEHDRTHARCHDDAGRRAGRFAGCR